MKLGVNNNEQKVEYSSASVLDNYEGCDVQLKFLWIFATLRITAFAFNVGPKCGASQDNNRVSVSITKHIPDTSPSKVHQTWLDFTWKQGGGLPIFTIENEKSQTRKLLPLFAEEELLEKTVNVDKGEEGTVVEDRHYRTVSQEYRLTKLGPFWKSEIENGSHLGRVSFSPYRNETLNEIGTVVRWDVTFTTLNRNSFWQSVTESLISDACDNLRIFISMPLLLTLKTVIKTDLSTDIIPERWLSFIWRNGGGLPLPFPPLALSKDGYDRVIIPPFLKERVIQKNTRGDSSDILYTVINPSLVTYPVYSHLGRVKFQQGSNPTESGNTIEMIWEVNVRPMRGYDSLIKMFTEAVVAVLARNFKVHIEDKGVDTMVGVYPPGGFMQEKGGIFQVRRCSWLGSVLYGSLIDDRQVIEQIKDFFQPWKWGFTEDEGIADWSQKDMILNGTDAFYM